MISSLLASEVKLKAHHHSMRLMGCHFVLTAVDGDPQRAWDAIRAGSAEIQRIEQLISSWSDTSETARINENAGIRTTTVSRELFDLIHRSMSVSNLTSGAFDISGTLSRYYWNFNGGINSFLPQSELFELRSLMDYRMIELDHNRSSVYLKARGMKIGFGGIGKGYAAYRAYEVMNAMGIKSGLINAAGDLMSWGRPPGADFWKINIPDPEDHANSILELSIPFGSVVTSGDYENFTLIDGERYSHIVDPRTGLPVKSLRSVTVMCPNPELGDALATAITVMGHHDGLALINRLDGVECLFIDETGAQHFSQGLK